MNITIPSRARRKKTSEDALFVLRITLEDIKPEVWRLVRVPGNLTLAGLHWVIQFAFGWTNSHLHQFVVDGIIVTDPEFGLDELEDVELADESTIVLRDAFPRCRSSIPYQYDFGDSWDHKVRLEAIVAPVEGEPLVVCLDGARACPPEDCGGSWGYEEMLASLAKPTDPEHESWFVWTGGKFKPGAFSLAKANRELQRLRLTPRTMIDILPPPKWR